MNTMKTAKVIILISTALFLSACGNTSKNKDSDKLTGEIYIDGSSTVYPITEAVAEEFRNVQPDIKVTIGVSGTGGGFKKFYRGESDINNASRPIKQEELDECKKNNIEFIELMVAYDGMAVIANPENDWLEEITVEELKTIWEPGAQGKITRWNQIRPEWPDAELHLYGPGVASGTYDYFTEAIVGASGASRGDFTASEDDNVLVQGIAGDKYALGFFGLAYFEENKEKLKLIRVDNGENAVYPTLETVSNGTYAPLSRPIYIYVRKDAAEKDVVQEFVKFYIENVPELAEEVGYIPLPGAKYQSVMKQFETATEASVTTINE
jgi:phosphate transport system substrate-binding protein